MSRLEAAGLALIALLAAGSARPAPAGTAHAAPPPAAGSARPAPAGTAHAALPPAAGSARPAPAGTAHVAPPPAAALPLSPVAESVPARRIEGQPYIGVNDVARLLDARRRWRADVRRLTLDIGRHRVTLVPDNPFAAIDSSLVRLPYPARLTAGELLVPAAFVDTLPREPSLVRLLYDPLKDAIVVLPPGGVVRLLEVAVADSVTRLIFGADRADEAIVADRLRAQFRLRFSGYFAGGLPAAPPRGSLVQALRPIGTASGCAFELTIGPAAAGFRLRREPDQRRVVLEISRSLTPPFEAFAPEAVVLPPGTPTVVLDPGHGGADEGVRAGGFSEKQLTLELARLLRDELEKSRTARVLLTRDDDREVAARQRAETANHARADLFVSLHFDGYPVARSRGMTVWCPPAGRPALVAAGAFTLTPWGEAALAHGARSRALAEAVRSAFTLRDLGPVRVREFVPAPLVGVDAPCLMLECATLTAPADAERLRRPDGLRAIAVTLAQAIAAWRKT
jgi:N-acetylmuramoyl-L-alanine amidase